MATGRATLKALVFAQQLEVLAQLIDADLNAVVRKVAFDLDAGIVLKTPVDTGRLRSSWRVSIGEVDLSVAPPGGGGGLGRPGRRWPQV